MNYTGHLIGGVVSATIIGGTSIYLTDFNYITSAIYSAITLGFALYPDLDIASKPSRFAFAIGIVLIPYLVYIGELSQALVLFLLIGLPKIFPHRGIVHTLKFGLLATLGVWYLIDPYTDINMYFVMISGMIGYMTHLILDKHIKL